MRRGGRGGAVGTGMGDQWCAAAECQCGVRSCGQMAVRGGPLAMTEMRQVVVDDELKQLERLVDQRKRQLEMTGWKRPADEGDEKVERYFPLVFPVVSQEIELDFILEEIVVEKPPAFETAFVAEKELELEFVLEEIVVEQPPV